MAARLALLSFLASSTSAQCFVEQIRLSLTQAADGSEMGVSWATPNVSTPAGYRGVVFYGTSPARLTMSTAPGDSRFYTLNGVHSPFLHYTVMTNLVARATYFYSIGPATADCPASAVFNFTAPPKRGASFYPFTVVGYGDMGISYSQNTATLLAARAAAGTIDLVVHAGDISYAE